MSDWLPETLPEDLDAERALISTLCAPGAENAAEEYFPMLDPTDFMDPRHRAVVKAAKILMENGAEISPLTLKDVVGAAGDLGRVGGYPGLIEILNGEEVGHPKTLVDILKRKAKFRAMIRIGAGMVRAAREEADDPDALMAGYVEDLSGDIGDSKRLEITSYADLARKAMAGEPLLRREHFDNLPKIGIPTLDACLVARPGSLGIIAGKSSVGKSALAIQIQAHTPQSLLVSLEMDDEEIGARLLSHHTGMPAEGFLKGTNPPVAVDMDLFEQAQKMTKFKSRTFEGIMAAVRVAVRKLGVRVVIVDYFQLLDPPDIKNASVAYRLGKMSASFKAMAKDLGICVVLLSQFNREVADGERPRLENLKETGGLEQDASWVILAWTEKPEYGPDEDRIVFMELAKNRGGKRWRRARVKFMPEKNKFVEQQNETDQPLVPLAVTSRKSRSRV